MTYSLAVYTLEYELYTWVLYSRVTWSENIFYCF